jgi:hypothetical protein
MKNDSDRYLSGAKSAENDKTELHRAGRAVANSACSARQIYNVVAINNSVSGA